MAYTTIDNPELYFQTVLWTGNGSSSRSITLDGSEDMQPDWTWIKSRAGSESSQQHIYMIRLEVQLNIYNQALTMQRELNLMVYQLLHQMVLLLVMIMQTMLRQLLM